MAAHGVTIDASVFAPGQGPGEVSRRVLEAFGDDGTYQAVSVGSQRMQFARTYRPTWAIVAAIALLPVALLGALLLLVKTTETCVVVISEDHRGTTLHLRGRVLAATAGQLKMIGERRRLGAPRPVSPVTGGSGAGFMPTGIIQGSFEGPNRAAATTPPPPPPASPARPSTITPDPAGSIVAAVPGSGLLRPSPPAGAPAPGASPTTPVPGAVPATGPIRLVFDTGEDRTVSGCALVGRDPEPDEHMAGPVELIAIDDPDRSVSRTHLTVLVEGTRASVADRGSTNGTTVIFNGGAQQRAVPGEPLDIPVGATVHFGERSFTVTRAPSEGQR